MNCWQTLGITPTGDETAIKTAYAARIREHRPDRDPAGFRRVRAAYEDALRQRPYYENRRMGEAPASGDASVSWQTLTQPNPPAAPACSYANPPARATPDGFTFTLTEPAAHDYQDGGIPPILSAGAAAALLRRLRHEWRGRDDAALPAILQAQAALPALDYIDLRSDYTAALQAHLMQHDLPHSLLWADAHYQLGRHDPAWQQQRQRAVVGVGDHAAFAASLSQTRPALAAWLDIPPLRRRWVLLRDWTVAHEHPAHRDWQQLQADSASLPLPPAAQRAATLARCARWLITDAVALPGLLLLHLAALLSSTQSLLLLCLWLAFRACQTAWFLFANHDNDARRQRLFTLCPPLRLLRRYYTPAAQIPQHLACDLAVTLALLLAIHDDHLAPDTACAFGTLWLIARLAQILWRCKRGIAAACPHPPWLDEMRSLINMVLLGLIAFPAYLLGRPFHALITLILTACAAAWLRIPPQERALRRALFDNGCLAILTSLTFPAVFHSSAADTIALLTCPITVLATTCHYRPLPLSAHSTAIISHLSGILLTVPLYLAASLTLMLLALPDSLLAHPLTRTGGVLLPLAAAAGKHPKIPPAALMGACYHLVRALLYLFTFQSVMFIAAVLVGGTDSFLPAAAFAALTVLHILAAWKAA